MNDTNVEEEKKTNRHLGGSSTSSTPTEEPTQIPDVQTEPLEMMGGSGLVSVPLSVPNMSFKTSISLDCTKVDPDTSLSSSLLTDDFLRISNGVLKSESNCPPSDP